LRPRPSTSRQLTGSSRPRVCATCGRLNVLLAFASNGHQFVEYDKVTGQTTNPRPLSDFPTPAELRGRRRPPVKARAGQFARTGTESLENPQVFQMPEVVRAGGLTALRALGEPADVLHQTKERLFAA